MVFQNIKTWLEEHQIDYTTKVHEVTLTSEDSARIRGDALSEGAKAIVYKIEKTYYLFVMAADRRMDPKKIKQHFKSKGLKAKKTRFANPEELLQLTGLVPGSVPPFGKPILDFDLFVDPSLQENEFISFNAGSLTNSLRMKSADYIRIAQGEVFDFVQEVVSE